MKARSTISVFRLLKQKIQALTEDQRSTTAVHIHLCLQAIVYENMVIPMSDDSMDAFSDMEETLRRVYIDNVKEIIALVPRPPIVMINHDKRFYACAHGALRRRENFHGYARARSFVAMELRLWGCVVVHGSSFWCKMVSSLHGADYETHVISTETVSNNDPHHHHFRAFAIYEKQLFCEKMIAACYMDSEILCCVARQVTSLVSRKSGRTTRNSALHPP